MRSKNLFDEETEETESSKNIVSGLSCDVAVLAVFMKLVVVSFLNITLRLLLFSFFLKEKARNFRPVFSGVVGDWGFEVGSTKGMTLLLERENVVCFTSLSSGVLFLCEEKSEREISSSKKESSPSQRSTSESSSAAEDLAADSEILVSRRGLLTVVLVSQNFIKVRASI